MLLLCIVHVYVIGSYAPRHECESQKTSLGVHFSPSTLSLRQSLFCFCHTVCSVLAGPMTPWWLSPLHLSSCWRNVGVTDVHHFALPFHMVSRIKPRSLGLRGKYFFSTSHLGGIYCIILNEKKKAREIIEAYFTASPVIVWKTFWNISLFNFKNSTLSF